ncbi:putative quorum-sensing-regulated virulence factor [Limnohabitans sp. Jir72]|uniref:putative quorum-sensing-regulated virulence factor n=1 Tax=Limnohabitans sp. Jir72 TaxID=1977909 RepID=UPI000D337DE5|nr:DUF3820 family protein [Limnohabitans sp. Jir72]PUE31695.1 hypothetical protein B9Z52_09355 [Limnohabitans sp. Jir72]
MKQIYSLFSDEKMTFGQHRGTKIQDLPLSYLKWLIVTVKDSVSAEKFALELGRREKSFR